MIAKRQALIAEYIELHGEVTYADLSTLCPDVSQMTLRRDLIQLEQAGKIMRIRGGAKSSQIQSDVREAAFHQRLIERNKEKEAIAKKALTFLSSGRSVYIDAGTTCLLFARNIPDDDLFVVTSSPNVALELISRPQLRVNLTGGQLSRETLALSGLQTAAHIKSLNIDIAFIGTSAFSIQNGFSCGDFYEAELKRSLIRKAQQVIMLMDQSKLNFSMPYTFARPNQINTLISEGPLPDNYQRLLNRAKVNTLY